MTFPMANRDALVPKFREANLYKTKKEPQFSLQLFQVENIGIPSPRDDLPDDPIGTLWPNKLISIKLKKSYNFNCNSFI